MTGGNCTYCGEHLEMYKIIESLCSTPEINITLYVHYTSVIKVKHKEDTEEGEKTRLSLDFSLGALRDRGNRI